MDAAKLVLAACGSRFHRRR
jgi:hypothetical protein